MTGLTQGLGILSLFAAAAIASCNPVPVRVEDVPKLTAVDIINPNDLAPIQLNRVGIKIRRGSVIGEVDHNFLMCARGTPDNLFWNQGPFKTRNLEFEALFYETLMDANFNVVGDPDNLFANVEREQVEPEYLVGGQIEDIRMKICPEMNRWDGRPIGNNANGKASIRVLWQVFSVFNRKVVFETETAGSMESKQFMPDGSVFLLTEAFADAAANLAASREFVDLLREKPRTLADVRDLDAAKMLVPKLPLFDEPITDNIDLIRRSVVTLDAGTGHGTGFFISPTLILTNHHVVANEDLLRVQLITGRKVLGEVIRRHPERDIALIQVEAAGHRPLPLRLEPVRITQEVYAVGSPQKKALAGTVSRGIVSKFRTNQYGLEDIQADVDVHGGNSGGPLLDRNGNVVGVTYAGISANERKISSGLNFFIPIYDALDKLNVGINPVRGMTVRD